jgi:hypothetical protein
VSMGSQPPQGEQIRGSATGSARQVATGNS